MVEQGPSGLNGGRLEKGVGLGRQFAAMVMGVNTPKRWKSRGGDGGEITLYVRLVDAAWRVFAGVGVAAALLWR